MSSSPTNDKSSQGLGNRVLLDKVDKLRELGISHLVPLPQMVVVGDQSAGKSSVLESLTGFHFPRSATLCTRHATEIVCRREPKESVVVSIIPHNPSPEREKLIKDFRRSADKIRSGDFPKIFEEAAKIMGIKMSKDDTTGQSAFSLDILKVEISGPDADHLTIIDVPGMFESPTPGLTTESDIDLVKNMILRFAAEADPQGKRTLGVLTKPDLAIENATQAVICDLVNGNRRDLHLGYCVVKNLGADDTSSSMDSRHEQERALFGKAPWNTLPPDRLGIPALRIRVKHLLMDRTRAEFPMVKSEVMANLKRSQQTLADMGESRNTTDQQRAYLGSVASKFIRLKNYGLDAYYTRHKFFEDSRVRLITRIRAINEAFSSVMHEKGHTREFHVGDDDVDERSRKYYPDPNNHKPYQSNLDKNRSLLYAEEFQFKIPRFDEDQLAGIISISYWCPMPRTDPMLLHLQDQYLKSQGYEVGTFNSEILPCTFKEQGIKWRSITLAHVSNAILIVHDFIYQALQDSCPDAAVREELWGFLLHGHDDEDVGKNREGLLKRYARAMDHAQFLLDVEFEGKCMTYDPRLESMLVKLKAEAKASARPSLKETRRAIHNVLKSYYDIALCRFVDVVCQQVIDHFLLHSKNSPLEMLSDIAVFNMSTEQLESIAGEDLEVKEEREKLAKDIESLTQALKILRV